MSVPKRWIDDGAPEPVRELLIAASGELPGEASAERTLVALGVSGALSAGAAGAAGASVSKGAASIAAAAKSGTTAGAISLAFKWGFIGAVSAMAAAGVATIAFSPATRQAGTGASPAHAPADVASKRTAAESAPAPTATNAAPEEARSVTPEATAAPIVIASPRTHAASAPATTPDRVDVAPPRDETTGMMEEVSMIDRARAAVARGDGAAALAALDAYTARFKVRRFEPEALYLRMEALGRAGDREGQRRAAQRLLTAFPSSPQSDRAREALK